MPASSASSPFVTIATFYSVQEAELLRAQLEGEGLEARLEGQHAVAVLPMHGLALGGVRVLVASHQVEQAKEMIAAFSKEEGAADQGAVDHRAADGSAAEDDADERAE